MARELPIFLSKLTETRHALGMTLFVEARSGSGTNNENVASILAHFGFPKPRAQMFSISRKRAEEILTHLVAYGQCYRSPTDAFDMANACAVEFVALFPAPAQFFTNTRDDIREASHWLDPLTNATTDSGVLAISPEKIGVLWFADED